MGSHFTRILPLLAALALCGCGDAQRNSAPTDPLLESVDSKPSSQAGTTGGNPGLFANSVRILENHCTSCHSDSETPRNGVNYVTDLRRLQQRGFIDPGDADDSQLMEIVEGEHDDCDSPRISDEEITEISDYIDSLK